MSQMAEVLLLPARLCSLEQADRLCADLAAAHARGEPLGSRTPHIQASSERLVSLINELENMFDDLERTLTKLGLQDPAASETLRHFVAAAQGIADAATQYSAGA